MTTMTLQDINMIEGEADDDLDYFQPLQRAINSGSAWSFQGSYGRAMMEAIESGYCMLGENSARDYWGNYIPSRYEVQEGTTGSRGYVEERLGNEWAELMAQA